MSKNKKFDNRSQDELSEGYKTVNTDLPSTRFQSKKQVVGPDEMGVTSESKPSETSNAAIVAAKTVKSKMKIRPDVSVDDLGGKQVGGVPLVAETGLRNVAGARTMSPADDMSRTPYFAGEYRPGTRYGKKRSEDLFELDNAITEQLVPLVEDLPDLKAAPDKGVGYNGRQQFKQTRQKKNYSYRNGTGHTVGKLPQQLLNDASIDFCDFDQVVYTTGQVITPVNANGSAGAIDFEADYPTFDGDFTLTEDIANHTSDIMHKSNYLPTSLNITVNNNMITDISISEMKFNAVANPVVRDEANMNWQIDANNVAKSMIKLQTEMGRETTDKWSPLGYVIAQPYQYNMLMHDIEATTGAIMAAAYRSAVSSLAYQRNIVKKDGINPQRNAVKMITEGYAGVLANNDRNTISDLDFNHVIWNQTAYRNGSAAAMIAMFDSTGKYHTKADLLGLQRSFGLHLSQADNNINPLHCKPEFIKALDKAHAFSTVDGSYNGFLPIFETKRIKLMNPLSLNRFLHGWKNPKTFTATDLADDRRDKRTGTYAQYRYAYADLRNQYSQNVQHPVIEGICTWLLQHEGAFVNTYGNGNITIPFCFDMQSPNMLSFLLCASAQDVARQRNIAFRDVLFAGEQSTYIWDDLQGLDKLNPLYSSQLTIGKYDEPLKLGKLAPDSIIRLLYGDHKQLSDHNSGLVQYFEPWYFNEQAMTLVAGGDYDIQRGFFNANTPYNASFPSIRDGVRHEYVDVIKSMDPKEIYLSLDRKLDIMRYTDMQTITASQTYDSTTRYIEFTPYNDATTNNNKIAISTIRYDGNSDGRIVTKYDLDTGANLDLHALGMYCIPKEIGYIDDLYTGLNVVTSVAYTNNNLVITSTTDNFEDTDTSGINCNFYNGGKSFWITSYRVELDANVAGSIDRSAALTETFYRFFAASGLNNINDAFINNTGLVPTRSYNDGAQAVVPGIYNLGSNNEATHAIDVSINTDSAFIWTTIQRWFCPLNPFANAYTINTNAHSYDPFETSYWFGICGFLAADYTQEVLERLSTHDQLGMDFTEDPNFKSSPIFR